jgi:hypothetical protein
MAMHEYDNHHEGEYQNHRKGNEPVPVRIVHKVLGAEPGKSLRRVNSLVLFLSDTASFRQRLNVAQSRRYIMAHENFNSLYVASAGPHLISTEPAASHKGSRTLMQRQL